MHVELMPAARRRGQRQRTILVAWAAGLGVWTLAWSGVVVVSAASAGSIDEVTMATKEVQAELAGVDASRALAAEELELVLATLRASSAVVEQVDWSRLIGAIADATGEDVVLRRCTLDGGTDPEADGAIVLDLAAYGRTSRSMSAFVLALEDTRIFDRVRLLDTRREPVGNASAVAFRIECRIGGTDLGDDVR